MAGAVPDYYQGHHPEDTVPSADDEEHGHPLRREAPPQTHGIKTETSAEADIQEKHTVSDRDTTEAAPVGEKKEKKKVGLAQVDGPEIEGAW
jgi:hypothetical protein